MSKAESSGVLKLGSYLFVIVSLFGFIFKNLFITGWTSSGASITPLRWISATVVSLIVVSWGHSKRSLSTSGALVALVIGFILGLSHYSFFLCLLAFFTSASKATKFKAEVKKTFEMDYKEGGMRNWLQVLCNGGMALELSLLYLLDIGSADLPVDFRHNYRASWLGMAVLGAIACCNGDTWASELGAVLAKKDPFLITTGESVPRVRRLILISYKVFQEIFNFQGTNGGVTTVGLLSSFVGGLVIGVAYYCGVIVASSSADLSLAPNQALVILVAGMGGLLGSVLDSILGAR